MTSEDGGKSSNSPLNKARAAATEVRQRVQQVIGDWSGSTKDKTSDRGTGQNEANCLGCRIVGGVGLVGASTYVLFIASRATRPLHRLSAFTFGGALVLVGTARMFNFLPFRETSSTERQD